MRTKTLRHLLAAGFAAAALAAASLLALDAGAVELNPLAGVYNVDNLPNVTLGVGSLTQAGQAANANGVTVTGAAAGSPPAIGIGGGQYATPDTNQSILIQGAGTGIAKLGQTICTASGATPQTCNGQRGIVTTGTLATATLTDASFVINNSSVTASSLVAVTDEGYSGTLVTNGLPVLTTAVPGSGTITVHITNFGANALNGTVAIGFVVLN